VIKPTIHSRTPTPAPLANAAGRARARGFTLLETSMALVIIGVGVLAFVEAQKSFMQNNNWSSQAATGSYLANEIREYVRGLPRHDPVTGLYLGGENGTTLFGWGMEDGEAGAVDIDDIDDLDGVVFGAGGTFQGPINAFGEVVPAITIDGVEIQRQDGTPESLDGWTQTVHVEKVDPLNFGTVRGNAYFEAPSGNFAGRSVDQFPLRVTVIVRYQGPLDAEPTEISRTVWIVPP